MFISPFFDDEQRCDAGSRLEFQFADEPKQSRDGANSER